MIEKAIVVVLLTVSLLALGNAVIVYKLSYYLESEDRVNLDRLIDNVEQLNRDRLLSLNRRLVTISKSDFGILLLLNQEFRRAVMWLGLSLAFLLLYLLYLQAKAYMQNREMSIDSQ